MARRLAAEVMEARHQQNILAKRAAQAKTEARRRREIAASAQERGRRAEHAATPKDAPLKKSMAGAVPIAVTPPKRARALDGESPASPTRKASKKQKDSSLWETSNACTSASQEDSLVPKKVTASAASSTAIVNPQYDLRRRFKEGQKFLAPPPADAMRAFYTSLLQENPASRVAIKYVVEHGLASEEEHGRLLRKYLEFKTQEQQAKCRYSGSRKKLGKR